MPVWEVHVSHKKGGWSIRHVEAPDRETAEADTLEDVFRLYSPEDRAEGLANAHISQAVPHPDWGYLQEHKRLTDLEGNPVRVRRRRRSRRNQPLTNSQGVSYSGSKASNEANILTGGYEVTTAADKAKKAADEAEAKKKKDDEAKAKLEKDKKEKAEADRKANLVTVGDLATESGKEARIVRRILRAGGYSAPRGEDTSNRYEWDKKDPKLPEIRKLIKEYGQKPPEEKKEEEKKTPTPA